MFEKICEPHYLMVIIGALMAAIIALGSGKVLGGVLVPIVKRLFGNGPKVNIHVGREAMGVKETGRAGCGSGIDPQKCPSHQAEHERSLKNESNIDKIFSALSDVKKEVRDGNERILLALVASGNIKAGDIPPRN